MIVDNYSFNNWLLKNCM